MSEWVDACGVEDVDPEDVIAFEHDGVEYAIYRSAKDEYFTTAGVCTHEFQLLCDGFVMGNVIECPKHNGRFDFRTGAALSAPALEPLRTFATRVEGDRVFVNTSQPAP